MMKFDSLVFVDITIAVFGRQGAVRGACINAVSTANSYDS